MHDESSQCDDRCGLAVRFVFRAPFVRLNCSPDVGSRSTWMKFSGARFALLSYTCENFHKTANSLHGELHMQRRAASGEVDSDNSVVLGTSQSSSFALLVPDKGTKAQRNLLSVRIGMSDSTGAYTRPKTSIKCCYSFAGVIGREMERNAPISRGRGIASA